MATRVYDLCVCVKKYEDPATGTEKSVYENIGVEMMNEDGSTFLLLKPWVNLAGMPHRNTQSVIVSKFAITPKKAKGEEKEYDFY